MGRFAECLRTGPGPRVLVVGKAEGDKLGATEVDGWALDKDGSSDGVSVGSEDGV